MSYESEVKQNIARKQKITLLKQLKISVNMQMMMLDKESDEFEDKSVELLSQLKGIETQVFTLKRNKNNSKFYEFIPSGVMNRSQRRAA